MKKSSSPATALLLAALGIMSCTTCAQAHGWAYRIANSASPLFRHNPPGSSWPGAVMAAALVVGVVLAILRYLRQRQNAAKGLVQISCIQKIAWGYAVMFFATTSLTYLPGLSDEQGNFIGLFKLDLIDDLLHFASGVWAMCAAGHSTRQSLFYFRVFGAVYMLDGVVGLITQRGILDFGLWLYDCPNLSVATNIGVNAPHILIGGVALLAGFVLGRKVNAGA